MARGGRREGAGRPPGVPNKATSELKELAREYTVEALEALVGVLREGGDAAKVSAAKELLDRGYGKARQPIDGDGDGGPIPVAHIIELVGVRPGEV